MLLPTLLVACAYGISHIAASEASQVYVNPIQKLSAITHFQKVKKETSILEQTLLSTIKVHAALASVANSTAPTGT